MRRVSAGSLRLGAGLTLVELLIALAVLAILAGAAAPPFLALIDRLRLRGVTAAVHADLALARMEAVRRNAVVSVSFRSDPATGDWCYAFSDRGPCDCLAARDCELQGIPGRRAAGAARHRVRLSTNFRDGTAAFYPARGTATAGTVRLQAGPGHTQIRLSVLGRLRVCSDSTPGYPPC